MRHISPAAEAEMKLFKINKKEYHSFFPCDNGNCECQPMVKEWMQKLARMHPEDRPAEMKKIGHLTCPKDKTGMHQYKLSCNKCNAVVGYVWARDEKLNDWCDFHYYNYHDRKEWIGAFGPHISPIDGKLCIECTCGNDTRDFRLNQSMPESRAVKIEKENSKGRDWGNADSKFKAEEIN